MMSFRQRSWAYLSNPGVSVVTLLARLVLILGILALTLLLGVTILLTRLL